MDCNGATLCDCQLIGVPGTVVRTATLIHCTLRGVKVESCMLVRCHLTDSCVVGEAVVLTDMMQHGWFTDPRDANEDRHTILARRAREYPCPFRDDFPEGDWTEGLEREGPFDNIAQMAVEARRARIRAQANSFSPSIQTMDSPMNAPRIRITRPLNTDSRMERTQRRAYASHMHPFTGFGWPMTSAQVAEREAEEDRMNAQVAIDGPSWVNEVVRPPRTRTGRAAKAGEEECPVCRVNVPTEFPSNKCRHALCPVCVDTLTARGERRCPMCREPW